MLDLSWPGKTPPRSAESGGPEALARRTRSGPNIVSRRRV
jgi:hypothetical protein